MTQRTSAWSMFDASSLASYPAVTSPVVKITANRRQVDKRFSVLGFTIDTGGLPYFEVLLTTDRSLFDPANAARRTSANFYASRQDVGLQRADGGNAVWLAPSAIVRGFASAGRAYYTTIAYLDERGGGPVLAQPIAELAMAAPFVSLSPDLGSAQSLSTVLGVPLHRLARMNAAPSPNAPMPDADASADAAEGEDGFGVASMLSHDDIAPDEDEEEERALAAAYADVDGESDDDYEDERSQGVEEYDAAAEYDDGGDVPAQQDDDYDDGFGGQVETRAGERAMAAAPTRTYATRGYHDEADDAPPIGKVQSLSATYPSGSSAPDMLADEEDTDGNEDDSSFDRAYDDYERDSYDSSETLALSAPPEFESLDAAPEATTRRLEIADMRDIVRLVAPYESGAQTYAAINADGEYEGVFGHDHPAYHRWHVGLSYGLVQFTQDSGSLGRLLTVMRDRDAAQFRTVFGASADELVRVTNLAGPPSSEVSGGRSVRVQPVAGADIWMPPWRARFQQAAQHVPFQAAQNQLAAELYLQPMLPFAHWLGLDTQRGLAILFDRAVQMGVGGARRWLIEAVGPVETSVKRQAALSALGYADLLSFQRATPGLDADGEWGPLTQAAMVAALRALGDRSPLPVPTREQMLDAIERRASGTPWAKRVSELRHATSIADDPFTF